MRHNLRNLNKMINAMADDDFKSVQTIAKNMSFNKKKVKAFPAEATQLLWRWGLNSMLKIQLL